jgi:hypothetical protein
VNKAIYEKDIIVHIFVDVLFQDFPSSVSPRRIDVAYNPISIKEN